MSSPYFDTKKTQYSLYQDEIYKTVLRVMDNPKLILNEDFFKTPEYIEKKKCPSGRKIKPFNAKKYEKDKFKINSSYITELRRRIHPKDGWIYSTKNNETSHILFLVYLLSLYSDYNYEKYKLNTFPCRSASKQVWVWDAKTKRNRPVSPDFNLKVKEYDFNCLRIVYHEKNLKKKNTGFFTLNDTTIEIPKNKIDIKNYSLKIALANLPNICKLTEKDYGNFTRKKSKPFLNLRKNLYVYSWVWKEDVKVLTDLINVLSDYPGIFFTENLGYDKLECKGVEHGMIMIKPLKKIDFFKGKLEFNKAYLNNVKDLPQEQKEHLKFLINLILLNNNTSLDSYVDVSKEKKKKFTISFSKVRNEYEKLSKNPSIKFIKDVNTARTVLKYLLILL